MADQDYVKYLHERNAKEREEAVAKARQEESEKYESKIENLKKRNIFKKKSKKESKKESIKSPSQVLKDLKSSEKTNREIREYKYSKSRLGRAGRLLDSFGRARQRQLAIARQIQGSRQRQFRQQRFYPRPQQQFIPVGFESDLVARQVEREVSGMGNRSVSVEGDMMARQINREVALIGNIQHVIPSLAVDKEALQHSKNLHRAPMMNVDAEVWNFANILNPRAKRSKRRR